MTQQILELFEDGDRARIAVDIAKLLRSSPTITSSMTSQEGASADKTCSTISVQHDPLHCHAFHRSSHPMTGRGHGNRPRLGRR